MLKIRFANKDDVQLILKLIKELSVYEKLEDKVVATEETLREWLFEKKTAEVLIAELNDGPIGYALFFYNFSTFLGRAGIYIEDIYIKEEYRGNGYGINLFKKIASIAIERGCGRIEWSCLNWNKPSIDFYLSLGAIPMDEWTLYRLEKETMEKLVYNRSFKKKDLNL